jgi:RNA polymerase sigma factor (sigma-70 family)
MATFQLLYQNLDRIEHAVTLPRWLAVTASRECLRLIRNRKVDASTSLDLESVIASEERSAEKNAILAVQSEEVRNGLDALDARCRRLLGLLYLDEEDPRYDEISEKLGMPIGAIGPTRARCLEKLRKILVSRGFEP